MTDRISVVMSNRSKVGPQSVQPYEGHWTDSEFIIDRRLKRSDLTDPSIKPNFIVYLDNGERVLVGWTDKEKQRLFYIKEFMPHPTVPNCYTLKVIRMRGPLWRKTIKAVKRGMAKWMQGQIGQMSFLYDTETISLQPMSSPKFFCTTKISL